MKLFLYRLSLTETGPTLFDDILGTDTPIDRVSYLTNALSEPFDFDYKDRVQLRFQPTQIEEKLVAGAICRWVPTIIDGNPSDPFVETEGGQWQKSSFFLNLAEDEQVIGIEHNPFTGAPLRVLQKLSEHINRSKAFPPYKVDVFTVNNKNSFFAAVNEYKGPVKSISFDLVIPNPTNGEGKTKSALKKLRKITNGDRFKATVSGDEALKTNSRLLKDAVRYAEDGGGDLKATGDDGVVYDSRKVVRSTVVSDELKPKGNIIEGLVKALKDKLKR